MQEWHAPIRAAQYVSEVWRSMASSAASFITEQTLASLSSCSIEAPFRRFWRLQAQLVVKQGRQLRSDQVWRLFDGDANTRIAEVSMAAHLSHANIAVPIGDGSICGVCFEAGTL